VNSSGLPPRKYFGLFSGLAPAQYPSSGVGRTKGQGIFTLISQFENFLSSFPGILSRREISFPTGPGANLD
jgi:hypothetical protein